MLLIEFFRHRRDAATGQRIRLGRSRQLDRIFRRILIAGCVLLLMFAVGSVGFYFIGGEATTWSDAVYMTLITLSTVGYEEVVPIQGTADRLFTGIISLVGFGAVTFMFTTLSVFFLEGDLDETLRRRRMEKHISKLKGHYLICGYGRVGRNVAEELDATHRPYVVIDADEERLAAARERQPDLLCLAGDASDDDLLLAANIEAAAGVFAVTDDDSRNLMIALTAKQLCRSTRVVARCMEVRNSPKLRKAGADMVIAPDFTGGLRIAAAMLRPGVLSFLDDLIRSETAHRVEEIPLPEGFASRPLETLDLPGKDVVLLGVREHRHFRFNPSADTCLQAGQVLVVMCAPEARKAVEQAITG
ncbi:potassium channel family protein [Nitrogeniibacter aestuarii]|uniref:potassium channel family protein n=1 Tax=Nitrogeniibacter aestuarii TaxID=2815343 RepID=UPI001D0FE64E|nr:potassium channel protein [Nitrogeniibacter aestuarii]